MKKGCQILIPLLVIMLTAWSCASFDPQARIAPEGDIPKRFSLYSSEQGHASRWWKEFGDPELDALIEEALSGNLSLVKAWARLRQANAVIAQSRSGVYPSLEASAGASYTRQQITSEGGTATLQSGSPAGQGIESKTTVRQKTEDYSLGLASSYEIDLWGRMRSDRMATLLDYHATREDLNTAAVSIAGQIAEQWINIISQRMQRHLLQKQLETNLTYLELVELRFNKGMVSVLDVFQQRQTVEQTRAQIPFIEAQERLLLNNLALLMGKPPNYPIHITRETLPSLKSPPAAGLPADLLVNRPDVRSAGLQLEAADWQVSAARANRLPNLSLSGSAAYSANELDLLFDNWILTLAGNLIAPILDGGQRAAEVDRTRAIVDERLSAYRESVVTAIKEVEDALINEEKQQEHIAALELQLETARKALNEAKQRYLNGLKEYLPVLTQLLSVQGLEQDMIQRKTELILYRVGLYRALGGTWTKDLNPESGLTQVSGGPGEEENNNG
ncbi:MAG: efflux transporter outer membrane subunit [Deltaproteobacteria bacterium]|nr:efflux transporter outer membrane subunit [Deltaproteobacteria bacterium]